jgi:hypothetical protein
MDHSSHPFADCAIALIVGSVAGVIVHVAQNARVLVKRIPQEFWQWNKDNEELTGLIVVALCVLYSVPRLWFFFRRNREGEVAPEEEPDVQQQQMHESSSELPKKAIDSRATCSAVCHASSPDINNSHSSPKQAAFASTAMSETSSSPTSIASALPRGAPFSNQSPRSFTDMNDFIKSPTMTSNGLAAPSAGVPHPYSYTPLEPPPALCAPVISYYAAPPAADASPPVRRQHPPMLSRVSQQQQLNRANNLQSLPLHLLHTIIRHLPLHSRCILARTCTCLNAAVLNAPAHVWHHSTVDISVVDGRLLKRVMQRIGHHVRCLTFTQGLPDASGSVIKESSGVNRLGDGDVCSAVAECPGLEELNCSFTGCCSDIELFKMVKSRCCPNLRLLNVRYCSRVTDLGLISAARLFTSLQVMRCSGNDAVTDAFLFRLSEHCPGLLELDCSNTSVSSVGVSVVLRRCIMLQKLYMGHCPQITDSAFCSLATSRSGDDVVREAADTLALSWSWAPVCVVVAALSFAAALADSDISHLALVIALASCALLLVKFTRKNSTVPPQRKAPICHRHTRARPRVNKQLPGCALESVDLSGMLSAMILMICECARRHALSLGLVNLSQIGIMLLIDRCGDTLKHFVLESSRISENVRCGAGCCQALPCLICVLGGGSRPFTNPNLFSACKTCSALVHFWR